MVDLVLPTTNVILTSDLLPASSTYLHEYAKDAFRYLQIRKILKH